MRKIQRYLFYLAVILMPIQDSILGKTPLAYLGSNVSFIPISASAIIAICCWLYNGHTNVSKRAVAWCLYMATVSLVYIALWGTQSHGFSVIHKTFAEAIIFLLWAYTVFYVDYTPTKGLKRSTYIAFAILIFGVLACDLKVPGLAWIGTSSVFHITVSYEVGRWRSFSMEPSTFSATVVSLGLASAHFAKRKLSRVLLIGMTLVLLLASQSKGGLLVIAISAFVVLFIKKPSFLKLIAYFTLCLVFGAAMVTLGLSSFKSADIVYTTATLATRFSLAVWTFIVVVHHPWGVGFSGFYQAMTFYLPSAMDFVAKISPIPLNFIEIADYVHGTDVPLDTKCFLFEYVASFGIPFLVAYINFGVKVIRRLSLSAQNNVLLVAFIYLLIGFSTYVNGLTLYAAFYVAGLAYREYKRTEVDAEILRSESVRALSFT